MLGIDPGLTRCGLGVVDGLTGRRAGLVAVGVVRTPVEDALEQRLLAVGDALTEWVERHRPDVVAVERVFAQSNVSTVMGTAQVSGVAMLVAARAGLPVALHTPSEVKKAVTGEGRAGKEQVTAMVTRILGLDERPRPADAADALALAVCHLWRAPSPGAVGARPGAPTAAQSAWARAASEASRAADRSPILLAARAARRGRA
ncbi:Holliday junction endonuclease RuvC [Quadrisphaera sp. DSM 44207]|nr:Holliday junction endonuclease RuvC [Quadrisphaera sp. DSM 44207]